eukprot:268316_1
MAEEKKQTHELTTEQLIEQFRIEPTISIHPSINESNTSQSSQQPESIIPTSNANAVQFTERPMYSNSYNPMHTRRNKAIQIIYQFLQEENLTQTLNTLEQETRIGYDNESKEFGVLLEAIDLRNAYYCAQSKSSSNTQNYIDILRSKSTLDEKPCINLLYKFHSIHQSNILCIDIFYYKNITYIICGLATRSLMILSCENIFNYSSQKSDKYNEEEHKYNVKDCKSRIISEINGLNGPPLYIGIDKQYGQYAIIACMDGSIYIIDLYSTILTPNNWKYKCMKHHKKYVIIGRWSDSSKYILTASHDNKSTLYKFEKNNINNEFNVNKIHQYEFGSCVEAITWISHNEFIISVRNSNFLEYYKIDDNGTDYLQPYLKCNINAFGDSHISFCIGDMHISKNKNFILAKTDHEKVLLMINKSEEILKTYYGSHSDLYTYTRCCFSKYEKYIYASHHNEFVIWDVSTGKLIYRQSNAHKKTLRDMCLDKKHGLIVTASFDRTIKIWSP